MSDQYSESINVSHTYSKELIEYLNGRILPNLMNGKRYYYLGRRNLIIIEEINDKENPLLVCVKRGSSMDLISDIEEITKQKVIFNKDD